MKTKTALITSAMALVLGSVLTAGNALAASQTEGHQNQGKATGIGVESFQAADTDRNGMVDRDEYDEAIGSVKEMAEKSGGWTSEVNNAFDAADKNKDGMLSQSEYGTAIDPVKKLAAKFGGWNSEVTD